MFKVLAPLFALALLLGLSACGTTASRKIETRVVSEPSLSFAKYRTYALAPPPSTKTSMDAGMRAAVNNALNTGLAARGITPSKTPDFAIVYHYTMTDKSSVKEYNQWQYGWDKVKDYAGPGTGKTYAFGAFMGNEIKETQYTLGTLIVDFVDINTQKMFWRGTSSGQVGPLARNESELTRGVTQMLQHIPVVQ